MGTGLRNLKNFARVAAAGTALAAMSLGVPAGALAEDEELKAPYFKLVVPIELQNDWNFKSDDRANQQNQLYTTIEPELTVGIWRGLTFRAQAVFEPVTDPAPEESRYFKDQGLYLETILLQYKTDVLKTPTRSVRVGVWGGKFTVPFGIAWDDMPHPYGDDEARDDGAPGVYGQDFPEDYELTERIGFGFSLAFDDQALGKHTLQVSTFFRDTSVLSESLFTNRGRLRLSDGGPANTGRLNSFSVSLNGEKPFGFQGLSYHAGFVSQSVTGGDTERGVALALKYEWKAGEWTVTPLIEFVHFWNFEGDSDAARWYLTTGISFDYKKWNFAVANTVRTTTHKNGGGTDRDNLFSVSLGYTLPYDINIFLAYKLTNEENTTTHTIGVQLAYEFSIGRSLGRKR